MPSSRRAAAPRRDTVLALLRSSHPEPCVAVTAMAGALAAATGRGAAGVGAVVAAVLAGQLSVGWHNDWLDAARDQRAGRTDKPVAAGAVPRRIVGRAAAVAVVAVVPLSVLSGWRAGVAHIGAVALAWMYNARLKATVWSWVPYAGAFALLAAFVTLGLPGAPWPPWWVLTAAALLGVGAHLANVAPDIDDDLANGIRGLPHRLGRDRSVVGAVTCLVVASALIAAGPGRVGVVAAAGLAAVVTVAAAGLTLARRPGTRHLFRAAMLIAVVDVVMLVDRGHALAGHH